MMDYEKIKAGVQLLLEGIGEDMGREGLLETPDRIARMCQELKQACPDGGCICQKAADSGEDDGSDRAGAGRKSAAPGRDRHAGGRAYLYDHARYQKAGKQDRDDGDDRSVSGQL